MIEEDKEKFKDRLTLQDFLDDMKNLGDQLNNKNLKKPAFHFGDLSITNYILWLLLSEVMAINDKLEDTE